VTGPRPVAIHAVTRGGLDLAARLAPALAAELRIPARLAPWATPDAVLFDGPMRQDLEASFPGFRGHVFVMAIGAVVRLLAPLLRSKWEDPAVVCLDEAGRFAVSVLSGHAGGANALCEEVAAALGAQPVITTASDVLGTMQVDLLGRAQGWTLDDPSHAATRASTAMVEGAPVLLVHEAGQPAWSEQEPLPPNVTLTDRLQDFDPTRFEALLLVTDRLPSDAERPLFERAVVYRPRSLALGVGCDRAAPPDLVARGVQEVLSRHRLAATSVGVVATIDLKADEPAFRELAARLGCPLRLFDAAQLDSTPGVETFSDTVLRKVGTRAVAEPAALLAAGAERLLVPRQIYTEPGAGRSLTVAVARRPHSPQVSSVGATDHVC
jgi:cobalt-precorrin 5A hydrolase